MSGGWRCRDVGITCELNLVFIVCSTDSSFGLLLHAFLFAASLPSLGPMPFLFVVRLYHRVRPLHRPIRASLVLDFYVLLRRLRMRYVSSLFPSLTCRPVCLGLVICCVVSPPCGGFISSFDSGVPFVGVVEIMSSHC